MPPKFKKQSRCRAIRSWMGTITCSAVCLQSDSCRRLSRALLPCIPHPSLGLDVARVRLVCGVASWRTCLGVSATCSTLLQQRTMTRTNLPAAKPYCSEHTVAQVACVVRTVRLPHPFSQTAGAYPLLLAVQHLMMNNQATRKAAAFVRAQHPIVLTAISTAAAAAAAPIPHL